MLEKNRILDITRNFLLFQESKEERDKEGNKIGDKKTIIKILAAYHQYFAVKKTIKETEKATSNNGDRKIGVVWHTQGECVIIVMGAINALKSGGSEALTKYISCIA